MNEAVSGHRLLRLLGWLLTPLVAWAGSFAGGWLGALAATAVGSSALNVVLLTGGAALGGAAGIAGWIWFLRRARRSPQKS